MRKLISILLIYCAVAGVCTSCSKVDDDFFRGKTWYIMGLFNGSFNKPEFDPKTELGKAWQEAILPGNDNAAVYYIQFEERNACTIYTENGRKWTGTFTYDLEEHTVHFDMKSFTPKGKIEPILADYMKNVVKYDGNNKVMRFVDKDGRFISLSANAGGGRVPANN